MARKTASFDAYMATKLGADPALNALYQRELLRLKIANQIVAVRESTGLSQAALAHRIGTKQPTVARMERASYTNYTLATLAKIAAATGGRLDVRIHPPRRKTVARSG